MIVKGHTAGSGCRIQVDDLVAEFRVGVIVLKVHHLIPGTAIIVTDKDAIFRMRFVAEFAPPKIQDNADLPIEVDIQNGCCRR